MDHHLQRPKLVSGIGLPTVPGNLIFRRVHQFFNFDCLRFPGKSGTSQIIQDFFSLVCNTHEIMSSFIQKIKTIGNELSKYPSGTD